MAVAKLGERVTLQDAATTGNGTAYTVLSKSRNHTVSVKGTGTTSGGTISIEEATAEGYAGTWSVITTVAASDVSGGAEKHIHFTSAVNSAIRARISSNITGGGTVTVSYKGF